MSPPPRGAQPTPRARRRPGRRPGEHGARDTILAAARRAFGERGYGGATIRAIATEAGVDPALVLHYFGTKADLFAAAVHMPIVPSQSLAVLEGVDRDELGPAILRLVLGIWADPDALAVWLGLIRSATADESAARMFRDFVTSVIVDRVAPLLDDPDADLRMALVGSQLVGLGVSRHVLGIEPLASAPVDELVAMVGPTLQRYLTGPLDRR